MNLDVENIANRWRLDETLGGRWRRPYGILIAGIWPLNLLINQLICLVVSRIWRILQYFCSRFKGQILPSVSVILIRKGASIEPPWSYRRFSKSISDPLKWFQRSKHAFPASNCSFLYNDVYPYRVHVQWSKDVSKFNRGGYFWSDLLYSWRCYSGRAFSQPKGFL